MSTVKNYSNYATYKKPTKICVSEIFIRQKNIKFYSLNEFLSNICKCKKNYIIMQFNPS